MRPTPRFLTDSPADIAAYVVLRREMLLDSPWSFSSSPGHDRGSDPEKVRASMAGHGPGAEKRIIVVERDGRLISSAGVNREDTPKRRHIAFIWGVYTTPAARRAGCARAVMRAAIAEARTWPGIRHVQLSVSARTPGAKALYESLGFVVWGHEREALTIDGDYADEHHMALRVD